MHDNTDHHSAAAEGVADPVCGMTVDPARAAARHERDGRTYYFCSPHCLEEFRKEPQKYAVVPSQTSPKQPHAAAKTSEYTCPMHPEVRQQDPGIARSAAWRSSR